MDLTGQVIAIVGGTGGLGLSAAQACLRSGARLAVVGRDADRCEQARRDLGSESLVLEGDAGLAETADRLVSAAVEKYGQLNGLYHVAGGSGRAQGDGPLDQISDQGWGHTLRLNLDSLFYSNRAAVRQFMAQGGGGSVLNMASVLADSPSPRFFATHAYATSKAAAIGLTTAAAAYYAPRDIRFNVIAPALIDTPLAARAVGNEAIMQYISTKQPLDGGRVGVPADVDQAAVFFLSEASRFITGQVLAVDGGWSVSEGQVSQVPAPESRARKKRE